jgi:dipeptidyl aminopeptidase/acylaminoacyl peptidase
MADGTTQTISPDTASVWDFQWSPDGKKLAVLFTRPGKFGQWRRGMLAVAQADGSLWKRLPGRADPTQGVAWSPDGEALAYYALPAARYSYPVLHTIGANGKRLSRLTPPDLPETEEGVLWTSSTGLIVSSFVGARCFITRIDPETGSRIRLVERSVPAGGAGASLTASRGGHLAFTSESFDHPAEVFILDHGAAASRRLTRMNSQLEGLSFPSPRVVHWTTFDGLRIEGILFLPPESIPRPVPLIVLPHGGPAWQWSLGFYADPLNPAPLLVAQGYALLFPNPRGSTGYGEGFSALNRGDLGGGDFRDIEAGVDSLVGAGVADPRRLAMSGYSYGGYMTAWTIAHTDRYRCAIIGAGPMNFYSDYSQNDLTPYWQQEFLGASPYQDPMVYLSRSPIFHVRNIWTPALIIHGADDVRVPLAQSQEMYTALKELGRTVEFYIYPREGHGLREPKHQIEFMKRQLEWFAGYLRPRNEG